jgi:hypothetical protein
LKTNPDELILFALHRTEDESGVSGTGTVAYGVRWPEPNGRVTLAWVADKHDYTSVAVYDSLDAVETIHGHGNKTKIVPQYRVDTGKP